MDWLDYREKLGIGFCDDNKFKYFKTKIFNALNVVSQDPYSGCMDNEEYYAFCGMAGMPINLNYDMDYHSRDRFEHCLCIIERTTTLNEFLAYYLALTNSIKREKSSEHYWVRETFSKLLCSMLNESHIPFELLKDNGEYFVFPKGAKELDDALVSQPLEWLKNYQSAHMAWVKALKEYATLTEDNISEVADKFRKALETFMQEFFNCDKTLENCKALYGGYLKTQGVPKELVSNFETLLQMYTTFINAYAKHHDRTERKTLEYIMYQTGNVIRLLITLKQEESNNAD